MALAPQFGLSKKHEIDPTKLSVDVRPLQELIITWLSMPVNAFLSCFAVAFCCVLFPKISIIMPFFAVLYLLFFVMSAKKAGRASAQHMMPLRSPMQEKKEEFAHIGDPYGKKQTGTGIFLLGHNLETNEELWLNNSDLREHIWITGTTGAGKTEFIISMLLNCMSWGSGFIFVDGKGDIATSAKIWYMARLLGRTDDFLLLNFMDTGRKVAGSGLLSNSTNPFSTYTVGEIMQIFQSLMPETQGDGKVWQTRALNMFTGVIKVLVWLRDVKGVRLSINSMRESIELTALAKMACPDQFAPAIYKGMPPEVKSGVLGYLRGLAGFPQNVLKMPASEQEQHPFAKGSYEVKLDGQTLMQHGYLTQTISPPLDLIAESYGSIFGVECGDVDMFDVVLNRRFLIVLLPGLQKSMEEMASLGRIVVASLKTMMGNALGGQFEGTRRKILDSRQTASPTPFVVIMDEMTYYMVSGLSLFPAQGRSLGFSFIFAAQSLEGVYQANDKEGRLTHGTTNTWITMFAVDENATTKSAVDSAGKGYEARTVDFETRDESLTGAKVASRNARVELKERTDIRDIRKQKSGEFIYQCRDERLAGKSVYIADNTVTSPESGVNFDDEILTLTHFVSLSEETEQDAGLRKAYTAYVALLTGGDNPLTTLPDEPQQDEIGMAFKAFDRIQKLSLMEKACVSMALINKTTAQASQISDRGMSPMRAGAPMYDTAPASARGRAKVSGRTMRSSENPYLDSDGEDLNVSAMHGNFTDQMYSGLNIADEADDDVSPQVVGRKLQKTLTGSKTAPKISAVKPVAPKITPNSTSEAAKAPNSLDDTVSNASVAAAIADVEPLVDVDAKAAKEAPKASTSSSAFDIATNTKAPESENSRLIPMPEINAKPKEKVEIFSASDAGDEAETSESGGIADYLASILKGSQGLTLDKGDDDEK